DMLTLIDLTSEQIGRITTAFPGGAGNIADIYPLAPLQEGIFFHHLVATGRGEDDPYLLSTTLTFATRTLLDAFLTALQHVVDRHDVRPTAVLWQALPDPVQVVARRATLPVLEGEVTGPDPEGRFTVAGGAPMDLTSAPLLRAAVAPEPGTGRWLVLLER